MYKKNKLSFIIFGALLIICSIYLYTDSNREKRTFQKSVIVEDNNKITSIELNSKDGNFILSKENEEWFVLNNGAKHKASTGSMTELLKNLENLRIYSVISRNPEKFDEYQVSDSLGKHFIVKENNNVLADFYVGKFIPSGRQNVNSYFRLKGKDDVYSLKGFFSMLFFNNKAETYRSKAIVETSVENIEKVEIYNSTGNYILEKKDENWFVGNQKANADSVTNYLKQISTLNMAEFHKQEVTNGSEFSARISTKDNKTTVVKGYIVDNKTILHSSSNEGVYFEDKDKITTSKLFRNKEDFIK